MHGFRVILKKELTDILRDKRSFIMLFVPVLLFPLMYMLMGTQLRDDDLKSRIPCIVHCANEADEALYRSLFEDTELVARRDIRKNELADLKRGDVYAVIDVQNGQVSVTFNDASTKSLKAGQTLLAVLENVRQAAADETLRTQYGIDPAALQPFQWSAHPLSEEGEAGSSVMASIAPMLLVMLIMSSGVSVAVDLFTGEKERGTMESLLTTQVSRRSILTAKFTATLCISLLGTLLSILAYVFSFRFSKAARVILTGGAEVRFASGQVCNVLAVCLALSVFAVSLMTMIGLHARTVKEAQSQMSLLTIFPTLLSGLTMFMESANIHTATMWIPVFNAIASIKMIFLGTAEPVYILFTAVSSVLYSALMWLVSARMLRSEKLLQG